MTGTAPSAACITGVILAAGPSTRFGGGVSKQLSRFDGEPLVRRAARTALASRLRQVLVVVGDQSAAVGAVLAGLAVEVVENPAYLEGQSTSVRAGLARVEPRADGALFLPIDQPLLSAGLIDRLIVEQATSGALVVVPTFEGRRRAPVLFSRRLFGRLSRIEGDEGGRQILPRLAPGEIAEIEVENVLELVDVDSLEDLHRLRGV